MEREKSAEAMWKKDFQVHWFYVIYTFYLHSFTFLTIIFETYNNIDSKTKTLFTLYEKLQDFKSRHGNMVFLREKLKN